MSHDATGKMHDIEKTLNMTAKHMSVAPIQATGYNGIMPTEQQPAISRYRRIAAENGASPLKNARHELFAQYVAQGKPASQAYQEVGYAYNEGNAIRLKAHERVRVRIAHLQAIIAQKATTEAAISKQYVLAQSVKLHEISMRHTVDESGGFVGSAAASAARALDQIGRHVDVQAFREAQDINVNITVDTAIARLARLGDTAIDADFEDVTEG
jgi:hypothetical protein